MSEKIVPEKPVPEKTVSKGVLARAHAREETIDDVATKAMDLSRVIAALLVGKGAELQSLVLADLVATYLAGVAPVLRPQLRQMFIELVDQFVPMNELELFGPQGHPGAKAPEEGDKKI